MALSLQRFALPDNVAINFYTILKDRIARKGNKSRIENSNGVSSLPENLIIEILSWLPVKELLKFKTVCKLWCDMISSPDFASHHLKHYYNNNDEWRGCLLAQYIFCQPVLVELLVDDETLPPRVLANEELEYIPFQGSSICGPCNGLYYLYHYEDKDRVLWNPVFRYELKVLPPLITKPNPPMGTTFAPNEVYGFGFDTVSRDYKVVVIKGYWTKTNDDNDYPQSVFVYTLKTDSWRYCGDLDRFHHLLQSTCYICVDGWFYWLTTMGYIEKDGPIICFDMVTYSSQELDLPNYEHPASICLGVYADSLALFTLHDDEKTLDVWMLNNKRCWSKIISMGPLLGVRLPIGHWKDNKLILRGNDDRLLLCDLWTQQVFDLSYRRHHWCEGVFAYMESLVSIKDGKQIIPSNRYYIMSCDDKDRYVITKP